MSQLALSKYDTGQSEQPLQPFQFKDQDTLKRDAHLKDSFQNSSSLFDSKQKMNDDADGQKSQQQNIENKDAVAGGIKWDAPSDAYYQIKIGIMRLL